jgi:spermidine synthase
MVPWVKLASAPAPGGAELSLWKRGAELVIRAGTAELMSNRAHGSEERLAELGCAGLGDGARVLVGGLGMGFTLRAVLALLPRDARVLVAELVPAVVDWVRGPIGAGALLDDPRVTVEIRDAAAVIEESVARFDAILLDVDNGPAALTQAENRWLYNPAGLAAAVRALRPGGCLAVWSAAPDPAFTERLARAGFAARAHAARAHGGRGARHTVFVGVVASATARR